MNRYEGNTGRFIRMPEPEPDLRKEENEWLTSMSTCSAKAVPT